MKDNLRVLDKRGRVSADPSVTPEAEAAPQLAEPALAKAPPPVQSALQEVDLLKEGDQFWVRGVRYVVTVGARTGQDGVIIRPVALDRATLKKMKRAARGV